MRFFFNLFLLSALAIGGPVFAQTGTPMTEDRAAATQAYIDGIIHFENEEYEQALDMLTFAHLKLSEKSGVSFALADAYLALGDLTNASYYGKIAVDLEPENKWYHMKLASIYSLEGRNEATIIAYKTALEYHPDDADILFQLADTYINFGELLEANKIYNEIMSRRGADFTLHLRKFRNFNALQMRDSAMVELQKMREIDPGNLTTLRTISQYYMEIDEEEMALEVLNEARERNSRDPQTLLLLAEIYVDREEWDELGEIFVTMLEDPLIYPSQKQELVRFIYMQHQRNPHEQILAEQTAEVLNAFSENEPDYGPAQILAAEFFLEQNNPEAAIEKLEQTNRVMPDQPDAWRQRMQVLFSLQRYDEVIAISDSADKYAPDDAYVQFFTGAAYMITDMPEKAHQWLEQASYAPSNRNFRSVINGTLGDVRQDLDRWEDAKDAYEQALRLDPNNYNAMNNYAYFMSVRGEQLDYARELAEKAISFEPENAAYLDTVGWIYYKKGEYDQAREYIQRSVDTGEASAEVYEHLGDVYKALNDHENAIKFWNKALDQDPEREYLNERIQSAQL
ncbi:tetratricopeptide repeat protein [soil metagenome]